MTSVCLPFSRTGVGVCRLHPLHLLDQSRWPPTSLTAKSTFRILVQHLSSTPRRRRRHRRLSISASMSDPSSMESDAAMWMFPLHRCKTIHLVRHAQGHHNVEGEKDVEAYMKPEYFDAALTTLGWQQVDNLRKHVHSSGLFKGIELVIVSPMMRTLQTAVGVFGTDGYAEDRTDIPLLMVENAGGSKRSAISSLNCPPIVAVELCREHLGVRPCDKRRNVKEYQPLFPAVDFSLIESEEDVWWKAEIRETKEEIAARGLKFVNWLWTRKEKEIAIVTHSAFLFHTLSQFGNNNQIMMKDEICKRFANCEVRSMVIVDRSMVGLDPLSTTNYGGKIPDVDIIPGSDTLDGKKLKEGS